MTKFLTYAYMLQVQFLGKKDSNLKVTIYAESYILQGRVNKLTKVGGYVSLPLISSFLQIYQFTLRMQPFYLGCVLRLILYIRWAPSVRDYSCLGTHTLHPWEAPAPSWASLVRWQQCGRSQTAPSAQTFSNTSAFRSLVSDARLGTLAQKNLLEVTP